MATKAPRKIAPRATVAKTVAAPAPTPVPPVADVVVEAAGELPVAAVAAVESVVEAAEATVAPVIEKVTEIVEAAPASLKEKGNKMADTVNNLKAQGEKIVAELKTRSEDALAKGKAYFADANDFNKGNIEALVESGKIAAKGFEKLGQDAAEYTRKSFEHTTTAFKGMAAVKSPTELLKLHSDYVRTSFDMFVAEASRSTEASLKLAGEIAQPISNRFAVAAEKVKLAA